MGGCQSADYPNFVSLELRHLRNAGENKTGDLVQQEINEPECQKDLHGRDPGPAPNAPWSIPR